jgi:transcriptional regulator with XRE-family HTH domain
VPARLKALKPKDWTDEPRTLGDHLKKRRREFDLLQREAAVRLGVSVDTYRGWEIGRIRPGPGAWVRIIGWLGYDPTPEPNSIGERLRAKRRALGWTEAEAAAHFGCDDSTIRRYERGIRLPAGQRLHSVQAFLSKD